MNQYDRRIEAKCKRGALIIQQKDCYFNTLQHRPCTPQTIMGHTYEYEVIAYSPKTMKYEVLATAETPGMAYEIKKGIMDLVNRGYGAR